MEVEVVIGKCNGGRPLRVGRMEVQLLEMSQHRRNHVHFIGAIIKMIQVKHGISDIAFRLLVCVDCGIEPSAKFYASVIISDGFFTDKNLRLEEHFRWTDIYSWKKAKAK